jgi:MATE family multidrug resistance protein
MPDLSLHPRGLAGEAVATLCLALPLVAGQLAQMAGGVVEVMLAGHLNAEVLGAVAVGNSVWMLPLMTLVGVMMAVSPSVAQLDGARRRGETPALFVQAAWIAVVLGTALGAAVFCAGPALADLAGIDPALHAGVRGFLRAVGPGAPAVGLFLACRGLCDGLSRTRVSMGFALLGLAVLAPLGWVLMYGRLGFPPLGAAGAGVATAAMCWVQSLALLAWLRLSPATAGLGWVGLRLRPDPAVLGALLRLGVPMAVSVLLEVGMFSTAALLIARFGPAAVAGHQIAMNVASLCFMVPLGLGMAITVRVGNAVGRADPAGVRRAVTAGLALVLVTQAVSCGLLLGLPRAIAGLYTTDPAVLGAAAGLLLLAAIFQFSDGIQVAAAGALRGLKDTRVPMLITAISYWGVGMPAGLYFAFGAGLRTPGLWIGLIAGLTVAAGLLSARLHRRTVLRG